MGNSRYTKIRFLGATILACISLSCGGNPGGVRLGELTLWRGYRQDKGYIFALFLEEYAGEPTRTALIVVTGDPPADIAAVGYQYQETTDAGGTWHGIKIADQPAPKVRWGQVAVWRWGDATPLTTRPLTQMEMKTVVTFHWNDVPFETLVDTFVTGSATSRPVSVPASRPTSAPGDG